MELVERAFAQSPQSDTKFFGAAIEKIGDAMGALLHIKQMGQLSVGDS